MQIQDTKHMQSIEMTDGLLAQQTLAGDQYAFESLVHRYSTPLFNFIYRFLSDYDQACDILQHVFIQLHNSLPSLRTDKPLKAWLFQVARNRCLEADPLLRHPDLSSAQASGNRQEYDRRAEY